MSKNNSFSEKKFLLVSPIGKVFELIKTSSPELNSQRCIDCGECIEICPTQAITERQREVCKICPGCVEEVQLPKEITEAAKKSCSSVCPVGMRPQSYNSLIAECKFEEAFALIKRHNPFSAVCGRVCHHPCEEECKRSGIDGPIAIRALHRFVVDYQLKLERIKAAPIEKINEKVAIVGAGPAGMTTAYYLAMWGYRVTIFEALPFAGGMLTLGIPEFRMSRDTLRAEIDSIFDLGVEVKYNTRIGKDLMLDDLFKQGYKAIFIAIGAHESKELGIEGERLEGVFDAISFMRDVNLGKEVKVGENVIVIGGGSVAMDVARTVLRLGAKKVCAACLETRESMPAYKWEIEEAEYEGVEFLCSVSPSKIFGKDGKVVGIEFLRVESIETDAVGRIKPITIKGSEFSLDTDTVIIAVGQSPDLSIVQGSGVKITELGTIDVDDILATSKLGVFAGGDAISVKASVIEAIASGKKAAKSIDNFLRNRYLREYPRLIEPAPVEERIFPAQIERMDRYEMPTLSLDERMRSFREVELGFTKEMAIEEANRCLKCGYCSIDQEKCIGCEICRHICPLPNVITMEALK